MNEDFEIVNGTIQSTDLGFHDGFGSIATSMLTIVGDGWGQGFGGWAFGGPFTHDYIYGLLNALEASSWEKLKGMHVRLYRSQGRIVSIGHIIKDKWFDPSTLTKDSK